MPQEKNPAAKRIRTLVGSVDPFCWSADGTLVICGHKAGGVAAWIHENGKQLWHSDLRTPTDPDFLAQKIAVHGYLVAIGGRDKIIVLSVEDGSFFMEIDLNDFLPNRQLNSAPDISWSPDGRYISISGNDTLLIYDVKKRTYKYTEKYKGENNPPVLLTTEWSLSGDIIVAASYHAEIWSSDGKYIGNYPAGTGLYDIAFDNSDYPKYLAGASADRGVLIWDLKSRKQIARLEGHKSAVQSACFTYDGRYLITSSRNEIRIWDREGWKPLEIVRSTHSTRLVSSPTESSFLRISGTGSVQIWQIDYEKLNSKAADSDAVSYTSAKIVLVGDSGVGKTGLGWRLAHGSFKEHPSTHGQQFWLLPDLSQKRTDGAICEAILWDLAGQPDYRLIHALFLDDADLALLVFDPTHPEGSVQGVKFWVNQLGLKKNNPEDTGMLASLVAARCDRGMPNLTKDDLQEFCHNNGLNALFYTSAATGAGVSNVVEWLKEVVDWDNRPATVTTKIFKQIKDYILSLKENTSENVRSIYSIEELASMFKGASDRQDASTSDVETALMHLSNHGYVAILRGSGEAKRALLVPELLNNLASSIVIEARSNPRGLGSLDEVRLLDRKYNFPEISGLKPADQDAMIDSVVAMLIRHNVCFREVDPLSGAPYIVFPELINSKKPITNEKSELVDDVSYTITGSVENVYASLVVLMGYTSTFNRANQWRGHARYEVGSGLVCGFRLVEDRGGEVDFVLYYGVDVGQQVRNIFKGLFESFLSRHEVVINRFEPVRCSNDHLLNRALLRDLSLQSLKTAHCPFCGNKVNIPDSLAPTRLTDVEINKTKKQEHTADTRHKFEGLLFKIKTMAIDDKLMIPSVFISYAWGDESHAKWVERRLATDLAAAGIDVILDKWHNAKIGASVPRFVEMAAKSDKIIVVGTPAYKRKYDNDDENGFVVAAEGDLIARRMIGNEIQKSSVYPIVLEGSEKSSLPEILRGRLYADFVKELDYEYSFIDLVCSIYDFSRRRDLIDNFKEHISGSF